MPKKSLTHFRLKAAVNGDCYKILANRKIVVQNEIFTLFNVKQVHIQYI